MKAEQLWASILQEAIQGKLVPQLESEPPSPCLCDQPEEIPFEIPTKWTWAYITNIADLLPSRNFQIKTNEIESKGSFPVVSQSQHFIDGFSNKEEKVITEERLPLIIFGDHTRVVKVIDFPFVVGADGTKLLIPKTDVIDIQYLEKVLLRYRETMRNRGYARHFSVLKKMPIPVPPLSEQKRIVNLLQGLKPLIDVYGKEFDLLTSMENEFPAKLKSSILQEAIQGRLVPQLESEPAVEQIGKLIDTKPFSIPSKWKWAQLKNVTTKITDGTHHSPPSANKGDFLYITAKNIKSTGVDLTNVTYVSKEIHEEIFKRCNPEYGDVLFIKDGATTGVVTINYLENPFSLLSSVALLKVKRELLLPEFLVYVLRSQYARDIVAKQMQGTGIPRVTLKKLKDLWIPIPPLNEQHRISQKLQDLITAMPLF